ncbi:dnaJ homolog subfamily C member 12-like [Tubulanus polymorphus]|uniref:dnaJ homolog subfamily C member 12-like n=1 Tax=Tubulanus polymorphus TaxID=672921 RepID=UPI003DA410C2
MESFLSYVPDENDDYYRIIGCDELSSVEQILTEYKIKALQLHPDKNPNDLTAAKRFALLQQAKEVLCDPESREKYDKWKRSGIPMSYNQWCAMSNSVHVSMHWSCKKKEAMIADTPFSASKDNGTSVKWWKSDLHSNDRLRKFRNYEI